MRAGEGAEGARWDSWESGEGGQRTENNNKKKSVHSRVTDKYTQPSVFFGLIFAVQQE